MNLSDVMEAALARMNDDLELLQRCSRALDKAGCTTTAARMDGYVLSHLKGCLSGNSPHDENLEGLIEEVRKAEEEHPHVAEQMASSISPYVDDEDDD